MTENNKISGLQLGLLLIGFAIGSTTLIFPGAQTKQNIWIVLLMGYAGGVILLITYVLISRFNPGKTLIEILIDSFGKWVGKLIALFYIWYFIHLMALVVRNFQEFMVSTIFIETPMLFIALAILIVEIYIVRKGIQAIARNNVFLVPILCLTLVSLFFALIGEFDTDNLFPLFEEGIKPLLKPSFGVMTFPFGELVLFLMIFPYTNKPQKNLKVSLISVSFAVFLMLMIFIRNLLVLGPDLMSRSIFASYLAVKLTPEVDVEVFIVLNLLIGGGVKISTCLYSASLGIKQIFGLNHYKPFVIPIAVLAGALSLWLFEDFFELSKWASDVYPFYVIPFQMIIPLLLLAISYWKWVKQKSKKSQSQKETIKSEPSFLFFSLK